MLLSRPPMTTMTFNNYDPFAASSSTSSFLPSRGLFSPTPTHTPQSTRPKHCDTILEEEGDGDSDDELRVRLAAKPTNRPGLRKERLGSSIALNPRVLRADSYTDEELQEPPLVLKFPVPPASLPISASPTPSSLLAPSALIRSTTPNGRRPAPSAITIPPTPEAGITLKSCFEDDSPCDVTFPSRISQLVNRTPPSTKTTHSPPALRQSSTAPLSLLRRATNALKSPRATSTTSTSYQPFPPTPSTASTSSPATPNTPPPTPPPKHTISSPIPIHLPKPPKTPLIVVPSPDATTVKQMDDYLDVIESYFPAKLWDPPSPNPNSLLAASKPVDVRAKSRAHRRNQSIDSVVSLSHSSLSSASSASSTSSSISMGRGPPPARPPRSSARHNTHTHSRNASVDSTTSSNYRISSVSDGIIVHPSINRLRTTSESIEASGASSANLKRSGSVQSDSCVSVKTTSMAIPSRSAAYRRPSHRDAQRTGSSSPGSPSSSPAAKPMPKGILKPSKSQPQLRESIAASALLMAPQSAPPVPSLPSSFKGVSVEVLIRQRAGAAL